MPMVHTARPIALCIVFSSREGETNSLYTCPLLFPLTFSHLLTHNPLPPPLSPSERYFDGLRLCVVTTRDVSAGDELCVNYMPEIGQPFVLPACVVQR